MPAIQQLVRDAITNRTYEATNAPVRVTCYDDGLEVSNPARYVGVESPPRPAMSAPSIPANDAAGEASG